jgi:hypothetical protein
MSKNWYALNINIDSAIKLDFKFEDFLVGAEYVAKNRGGVWGFDGNDLTKMFTSSWLEYMQSIDLDVEAVLIFYRMPHFIHPEAHIDYLYGKNNSSNIAINWVVGIDDSEMVWYHTPSNVDSKVRKITPSGQGHEYIAWPIGEVVEIERHTIGNIPTVVRVDIPHNIIVNRNPRWSVSVRIKGNIRKWKDIVEKLSMKIL